MNKVNPLVFFFLNDTATTEIYTLPLHDALPIYQQRYELEMLQKMNRRNAGGGPPDPRLEARIQAFQLAARMQLEAREAFEISGETEVTRKLYGLDDELTRDYGWE